MSTPEERAKRAAYMRKWRAAHAETVRERDRAYGRTPEGRAARNAALAAWKRRNPERANAHHAVWGALRSGRLTRGVCHCGETAVEAHHHRGYDIEHRLDVVWLCRPHHQETHDRGPFAARYR